MDVPEHLRFYIDYEALGRDLHGDLGGVFTQNGYVLDGQDTLKEYYSGRDDLPEEHKIFSYPPLPEKMPVKKQLELYGKMSEAQKIADALDRAHAER